MCCIHMQRQAHSGPSQTSKVNLFARTVSSFKLTLLYISVKASIPDVWGGPEYASGLFWRRQLIKCLTNKPWVNKSVLVSGLKWEHMHINHDLMITFQYLWKVNSCQLIRWCDLFGYIFWIRHSDKSYLR